MTKITGVNRPEDFLKPSRGIFCSAKSRWLRFAVPVFGLLFACTASTAIATDIDFGADVYSVLRKSCFECHGEDKQEGGLRLDRPADLKASGSVVPHRAEDSELLRRVLLPAGHDEVMPAVGNRLSPGEIAGLKRWVEQGAAWPADFRPQQHWSYVAPQRPVVPDVTAADDLFTAWPRNAIDHFVADRLREKNLHPSAEAAPQTIIRRVFLDLIGLPPTPEEVEAFAANPSDDAYRRLVNELLQRPQFGERWARPWLDLARYADSHGFQRDNFRDIWAYRDWVIRALNDDMPFDQFTLEQIAGDLLPNASESQRVATGFHRCTPTNVEAGSIPEETRIEQVIDRVNTTGAVWLGTTLECCQCHDHKYDPFSARDYYRLLAFYNNTVREADRTNPKSASSIRFEGPYMNLSDAARDGQRAAVTEEIESLTARQSARLAELQEDLDVWVQDLATQSESLPQTHVLKVLEFQSQGDDDEYELLDDGSVLLTGARPPATDTYDVTLSCNLDDVVAIQLETLTHDALPGRGPGRGDPQRTNFVLNHFSAEVVNGAGQQAAVSFSDVLADFSQKGWEAPNALQPGRKTGWAIAPQFGKPHWAKFVLRERRNFADADRLNVRIVHEFGRARSIGRLRLSAVTGRLDSAVPKEMVTLLAKPLSAWNNKDRRTAVAVRAKNDKPSQRLTRQLKAAEDRLTELKADTTLVMIERPEPRMTHVFERGDYRKPGEQVTAGTPAVLHSLPEGPANRITLARWLTSRDNPLVARVTVNRWWLEIFGEGLVGTPEDFGLKGDLPTHPKLLDWLAVEFMESGWSMKHILRTIVLSSTYRQSSVITDELSERDDRNRLLARGPRLRMDAEMIRDNVLAVSGLLSLRQFGPSIRPWQPKGIWSKVGGTSYDYKVSPGEDQYRRGIYVVIKRGAPYPSFINFDATARLACTVERSRTNTPLQALTLLNDPVYVEAAQALAARVLKERQAYSTNDRLAYAFQLCTARRPTERELGVLTDLLETQLSVARGRSQKAELPTNVPDDVDAVTFSAWTIVATTLINLHETITKN